MKIERKRERESICCKFCLDNFGDTLNSCNLIRTKKNRPNHTLQNLFFFAASLLENKHRFLIVFFCSLEVCNFVINFFRCVIQLHQGGVTYTLKK